MGSLGTSAVKYADAGPPVTLALDDKRPTAPGFSHGTDTIHVEFGKGDEMAFLREQLVRELKARGVAAQQGSGGTGGLQGRVRTFQIRNRQASGFSPVVTYLAFAGDFTDGQRTERIVAYSKQLKLPIWSMREVDNPCYRNPLRNLAGEIVAKLERAFGSRRASDDQVAQLVGVAGGADATAALAAINDLATSNNPAAIPALTQLSGHDAETFRAAALSGLGTLGAADRMPLLQKIWQTGESSSDRYMALKAIGDLGTPQAIAFMKKVATENPEEDIQEITALYLADRPQSPATTSTPAPVPTPAPATGSPGAANAAPAS